jgi:hypothetical protein
MIANRVLVPISCVGCVCCVVGWVGAIVGPRSVALVGAAGFALGVVGHLATKGDRPQGTCGSERAMRFIRGAVGVAGLLVAVALPLLFISAWNGGVADFPALEPRSHYELNNHGIHTAVVRSRYVLVSASFATAWHAMALLANLTVLSKRLRGEDPGGRG